MQLQLNIKKNFFCLKKNCETIYAYSYFENMSKESQLAWISCVEESEKVVAKYMPNYETYLTDFIVKGYQEDGYNVNIKFNSYIGRSEQFAKEHGLEPLS